MTIHIGIDEVGRGAGFGPFSMAVVRIEEKIARLNIKVKDSKLLTPKKRENMVPSIRDLSSYYKIVDFTAKQVDQLGIQEVTKKAIEYLVTQTRMRYPKETIYIDGRPVIVLPNVEYLVKGDSKIPAISAASIIAKVHRDKLVSSIKLSDDYGIVKNKGYLTKQHINAIKKLGVTPYHRLSFLNNIYNDH